MYAGEAAVEALRAGDVAADRAGRLRAPAGGDVRAAATTASCAGRPELVLSDRVQHLYPKMVTGIVERMFRVDNPEPKPGVRRIVRAERKRAGIRRRDLARDALGRM